MLYLILAAKTVPVSLCQEIREVNLNSAAKNQIGCCNRQPLDIQFKINLVEKRFLPVHRPWVASFAEILLGDVVPFDPHADDVLPHSALVAADHVTIVMEELADATGD